MRFKLLIFLLFFCSALKAQTQEDVIIKDLVESIAENLPEDFDLSELIERLTLYKRHPIDLNKTTTEELNSLFFLSPLQISNLFTHIKVNGKLTDILELQAIDGFDLKTITTLQLFATINAPNPFQKITLNNLIKLGYNDLVVRYGQVIEQQRGFTDLLW
jgi:hypothetical protein